MRKCPLVPRLVHPVVPFLAASAAPFPSLFRIITQLWLVLSPYVALPRKTGLMPDLAVYTLSSTYTCSINSQYGRNIGTAEARLDETSERFKCAKSDELSALQNTLPFRSRDQKPCHVLLIFRFSLLLDPPVPPSRRTPRRRSAGPSPAARP